MVFEVGVLDLYLLMVVCWMWLQLGWMFLVDIVQGCIVFDEEIKVDLVVEYLYQEWFDNGLVLFDELLEGKDVWMFYY